MALMGVEMLDRPDEKFDRRAQSGALDGQFDPSR